MIKTTNHTYSGTSRLDPTVSSVKAAFTGSASQSVALLPFHAESCLELADAPILKGVFSFGAQA